MCLLTSAVRLQIVMPAADVCKTAPILLLLAALRCLHLPTTCHTQCLQHALLSDTATPHISNCLNHKNKRALLKFQIQHRVDKPYHKLARSKERA
jgi:hypothetical protein